MTGQAAFHNSRQSLLTQPPAVDYIQNRMWQYHDAFNTQLLQYNPIQGQFVAIPTYAGGQSSASLMPPNLPLSAQPRPLPNNVQDMDFWITIFPKAMQELKTHPAPKCLPKWSIRDLSGWPEVEAKLEQAQGEYNFQHNVKNVGKVRRYIRRAMDKSVVPLQQGVKVIPSVDMASPIIRVADLLLDAYRHASEVRESINDGFDNLFSLFEEIDFNFRTFPRDENILKAAIKLVSCTLRAVEGAVLFYTSTQAKRAGLAILTGEQYQESLQKKLTEMKEAGEALLSQAEKSFYHHVVSENKNNRLFQEAVRQDNWENRQALMYIMEGLRVDRMRATFFESVANTVLGLFGEWRFNQAYHSPVPSRPGTPLVAQSLPLAPKDLWSRLHIPNFDEPDLRKALDNAVDVLYPDLCRAEQMLTTPVFRHWFLHPNSSKLLVHGDFDNAARVSPFSTLCATVMKGFRISTGIISLIFFCGRHLHNDEFRGGDAMIRSLIAQLLRQWPYPNIEPGAEFETTDLATASIARLCQLFVVLVRQLPAQMPVFCIIEGINEYEREEYLHTMDKVVLTLLTLADGDSRARFKLLLTSPRSTFEVKNAFDDDGALLNLQHLPRIDDRVNFAALQNQLENNAA